MVLAKVGVEIARKENGSATEAVCRKISCSRSATTAGRRRAKAGSSANELPSSGKFFARASKTSDHAARVLCGTMWQGRSLSVNGRVAEQALAIRLDPNCAILMSDLQSAKRCCDFGR